MTSERHWWQPPASVPADDEHATTMGALLHWVTLMVAVLDLLVGTFTWLNFHGELRHVVPNLLVLGLVAVTQFLLRAGRVRLAAHIFMFALWLTITVFLHLRGGTRSPLTMTYFASIAVTTVVMSRAVGLIYAFLSMGSVAILYLAAANGFRPEDPYDDLTRFTVTAGALMMTGGVTYLGTRLREAAAQRARESESHYADLVRSAPDAVMLIDDKGRVASANPAAERLFGAPVGQLLGKPLIQLADIGVIEGAPAVTEVPRSTIVHRSDGVREVEYEIGALHVGGRDARRLSVRDVTARHEAERERDRVTAQLNQSQKLESVGLLAGGVAHDFNNLTTVIIGNTEMLRATLHGDDAAREQLDDVAAAALRAADLTRQLLAFSRRQLLAPKNISVNDTVFGVEKMLRRLLREDIAVHVDARAQQIVCADPGQLEQVLVNLAVNARDAMPAGGRLTFETTDGVPAVPGVGMGVHASPHVVLRVRDTGIGMSEETVGRIFEPFFTTKPLGSGTGLGLSVVEGIVKQSGGTIRVETAPGSGTTIEILLPAVEHPKDSVPAVNPSRPTRGHGTILLVEDEALVRAMLVRLLENAGYQVLQACDGEEAIACAARHDGAIDLVLTDVTMPRLSGPRAVERLRETRPSVRVLFMSGHADGAIPDESAGEAIRFLLKPFQPAALLAAVSGLIHATHEDS